MKRVYKLIKDRAGFLSVDQIPSKEELTNFYQEKYFQSNSGNYKDKYEKWEMEYFKTECKIIEYYLKASKNKKKFKILDLGCGEGFQSSYFFNKGYSVTCVDYSSFGIERFNPSLLKNFKQCNIEEFLQNPSIKYDLILLKNVLEHVPNPRQTLTLLKNQLSTNGVIYCDVPNDYSKFQKFLVQNKYCEVTWFCPPEHLHYFTIDSLSNLCVELGFNIISKQGGFPIEMYLANKNSNYYRKREKGRDAHKARCEISNFLANEDISRFINFRESLGSIEIGRNLVFFLEVENNIN